MNILNDAEYFVNIWTMHHHFSEIISIKPMTERRNETSQLDWESLDKQIVNIDNKTMGQVGTRKANDLEYYYCKHCGNEFI